MRTKLLKGLIMLLAIVMLTSCSTSTDNVTKKNDGIRIMTSFYPVYEFTKNIVGEEGEVNFFVDENIDIHDYKPVKKDIKKIENYDTFVYNNENLEEWIEDVKENAKGVTLINASKEILLLKAPDEHDHEEENSEDENKDSKEDEHHHKLDSYIWLSPKKAIIEVENIRDGLIEKYPNKKDKFIENANNYIKELVKLDKEYDDKLKNAKQKMIISQKPTFSYLALDYGLEQMSIDHILSHKENNDISDEDEIANFLEKTGNKYVYMESNTNDIISRKLKDKEGVELLELNPLERLSNNDVESGETYIKVMKENLMEILKTTSLEPKEFEDEHEKEKTVYNGYFEDDEIKDRPLSDYAGSWQSVYPYLQDGTFDQVFEYKEKLTHEKTKDEYKEYYRIGYKTDIDKIKITDSTMEFIVNGESYKSKYKYTGKEILTYEGGNRGVRFTFEATDETPYRYVQFSDHNIAPMKTGHFHIYYGNESQEKLLTQLDSWPTYYPENLSGFEIAQDMLAH